MSNTTTGTPGGLDAPSSNLRNWLTLGVLFLVALSNYLDRSIIVILQVPIKAELNLSDTQLGAMTGLAFALCYTTLGLPASRLADRTSRKGVLAVSLSIWSAMTMLCGFATGFATIFMARVGVAVGEAAGSPTSHALVADQFPLGRRAIAMAIWSLAIPAGAMFGLGLGGWLSDTIGWRSTFIVIGATGIILVPLLLIVVRPKLDPVPKSETVSTIGWRQSFSILWNIKTFRYLCLAGLIHGFGTYASYSWSAPYYNRVYGLSVSEVGFQLALMSGIGGIIGMLGAGFFADHLGRRDPRWYALVPAYAALILVPAGLVQFLTTNLELSLMMGMISTTVLHAHAGPVVSTVQSLVPEPIRAFGSAVLVLVSGLAGLAIAPLLIGMMSDAMIASGMPASSLRYAIAVMMLFPALAALTYFIASRHIVEDLGLATAREAALTKARLADAGSHSA